MTDLDPLAPPRDQWPPAYSVAQANREARSRRRRIRTRTDRLMRHHRPSVATPRIKPTILLAAPPADQRKQALAAFDRFSRMGYDWRVSGVLDQIAADAALVRAALTEARRAGFHREFDGNIHDTEETP